MIFCNQDISKTITAMSFKLGQLIEDNEWIKKKVIVLCEFRCWKLVIKISQKLLQPVASNLVN